MSSALPNVSKYSASIAVYEECWIHLGNGIDDSDKVYFVHS